jgi:hypothetical protein
MNLLYVDIIKEKCFNNEKLNPHTNKKEWWIKNNLEHIYDDIFVNTAFLPLSSKINQRIYTYVNNLTETPKCKKYDCNNNVNWHNGKYLTYCSPKCNSLSTLEKRKETNSKKYGVDNPFKSKEIKEKIRETTIEKYGVENFSKTDKFKKEMSEKWKNNKEEWLEKRNENIQNYGYKYPFENKEILKKSKDTLFEKYGKYHPLQVEEILQKVKNTNIEKYGVSNFLQKDISNVFLENRNNKLFFENLLKTHSIKQISIMFNISYSLLCQTLVNLDFNLGNYSGNEVEIFEFISKAVNTNIIRNDRKQLNGKELDIYIPEYNLAIEHNGIYWHSDEKIDKNYHLNKTKACEEKGINLIHIFEHEWLNKKEIVKSILNSKFNKTRKIYARNCIVKKVEKKVEKSFLEKNHIQSYYHSAVCYGLYYDEELVQLMSFGIPRFGKKYQWELLRLSTKLNISVIGGSSKLFNRFIIEYDPDNIVSYCDVRYFSGNIYSTLGFNFLHISSPNYYYVNKNGEFGSRYKFQKHKLKTILKNYDNMLSEWQNMKSNGYSRIWDCGNKVYIYQKKINNGIAMETCNEA